MNTAKDIIYALFNMVLNQKVTHAQLGHGSFLTLGWDREISTEVLKWGEKNHPKA